MRAEHARGPLIQYWWDGDGFPVRVGNDGRGEKKGVMATNEVELGRGAVDSSRGLGMGVGSGEGMGHERQYGRYPPRSVGEVLDLVRLQIPTQNPALPV